ncbi:hypothetical protein DPMN_123273 [Dreissena polymorpha]|uniref:DNA 3'-5' helicase n=1 Tax=Dreissena polymorpha TaxID=45954 RepID=A0A9D4JSQ8_DREPO|nr:hypothetical protein DPMN_123273 [Dreissena polymorpha]
MGVNIPNVSLVVHWGAPKSFLTYWQEVGRAGREGKQALAVLIPYKRSCLTSMCDGDFSESLTTAVCVRNRTLTALLTKDMDKSSIPVHDSCENTCDVCVCKQCLCCSVCYEQCLCPGKADQIKKSSVSTSVSIVAAVVVTIIRNIFL